ncbi:hypothetical protein CEXT_289111, partial [Caerostris extrusa]
DRIISRTMPIPGRWDVCGPCPSSLVGAYCAFCENQFDEHVYVSIFIVDTSATTLAANYSGYIQYIIYALSAVT